MYSISGSEGESGRSRVLKIAIVCPNQEVCELKPPSAYENTVIELHLWPIIDA